MTKGILDITERNDLNFSIKPTSLTDEEKRKREMLGRETVAEKRRSRLGSNPNRFSSLRISSNSDKDLRADNSLPWSLQPVLADGVILCELLSKISPELIPIINKNPNTTKSKENIYIFLQALEEMNIPRHKIFQVSDLHDNYNFFRVLQCLESVSEVAKESGLPGNNST